MRIFNIAIMLVLMLVLSSVPSKSSARVIDNSFQSITNVIGEVFDIIKSFDTPNPDKSVRRRGGGRGGDDDDHYGGGDDDDYGGGDDDDYGGGDDDDDDDDDGNDIPLDGGLSFLAIAGAGLGVKKVVEHRNKKK